MVGEREVGRMRDQMGRIWEQDGFLSCGTGHLCLGALMGADADHLSPYPLLFLQFVTNCSSGWSCPHPTSPSQSMASISPAGPSVPHPCDSYPPPHPVPYVSLLPLLPAWPWGKAQEAR